MKNDGFDRRAFLKGAVAGAQPLQQSHCRAPPRLRARRAGESGLTRAGQYLRLSQIPTRRPSSKRWSTTWSRPISTTPKGTDLGLNTYIDRALARRLGQGRPPLHAGPVEAGGADARAYQLPSLPPSFTARASPRPMRLRQDLRQELRQDQREPAPEFLLACSEQGGVENGPPRAFFSRRSTKNVMEGMFRGPDLRRQTATSRLSLILSKLLP